MASYPVYSLQQPNDLGAIIPSLQIMKQGHTDVKLPKLQNRDSRLDSPTPETLTHCSLAPPMFISH